MNQGVRGLTLIELIVFIGALTVAAAIYYPKFVMLQVEARKALVMSMGSAVKSAARQAHYLWLIRDKPASIQMDGKAVDMNNGYPDRQGIEAALMDYTGFEYQKSSFARFRKLGAAAPNTCMVRYEEADPDMQPAVTVFTSGC